MSAKSLNFNGDGSIEKVANWNRISAEVMLDSSSSTLNSAAFGSLPKAVYERLTELRAKLATNPSHFMLKEVPTLLWEARVQLANYLGGSPQSLVFSANTSSALNLVVSSLYLNEGDEILTTEYEYPTAQWCWQRFAHKHKAEIKLCNFDLSMTDREIVESFAAAITASTKVLFLSHVVSSCGRILPVDKICELASIHGIITVVDGAQAVGNIEVRLSELDCDFYVSCGHKWLLMPSGTGFLYLGKKGESRLEPLVVSWGSDPSLVIDDQRDRFGSTSRLRRLECEGTRDICPWLVAPEAIKLRQMIGTEQIQNKREALVSYCRETLNEFSCLALISFPEADNYSGIVSFVLTSDIDAEALKARLWARYKIDVGLLNYKGEQVIRVSCHFFNTASEIAKISTCLTELN